MNIRVNIKQLGKKKDRIKGVCFKLENKPSTVRQLIEESVKTCVREYNERLNDSNNGGNPDPLSKEQIDDMSDIGKIAVGINYGEKEADEKEAIDTATLAYEDGLYRIFIGTDEVGELNSKISLEENAEVTFIRLVMLAGRLW